MQHHATSPFRRAVAGFALATALIFAYALPSAQPFDGLRAVPSNVEGQQTAATTTATTTATKKVLAVEDYGKWRTIADVGWTTMPGGLSMAMSQSSS